jgi:hypothetical protein
MHRFNPTTHEGYLLIAHTAFQKGVSGRGHVGKFLVEMVQDPFYLTDSSFVLVIGDLILPRIRNQV